MLLLESFSTLPFTFSDTLPPVTALPFASLTVTLIVTFLPTVAVALDIVSCVLVFSVSFSTFSCSFSMFCFCVSTVLLSVSTFFCSSFMVFSCLVIVFSCSCVVLVNSSITSSLFTVTLSVAV